MNAFRLAVGLILFVLSLWVVIDADWLPLWLVSLGVREFGYWLAPLSVALLVWNGLPDSGTRWSTFSLGFASLCLFAIPSVLASLVGQSLPFRLEKSFGPKPASLADRSPFEFQKLWTGTRVTSRRAERLVYWEQDGVALHIDYYRTSRIQNAPCVLVLHTGSWNSGSTDEFVQMNHHLVDDGYNVAAVEYRLAPQWQWPAQREDVVRAVQFLKQSGLGADGSGLVLLGRSAGGQIAEAVAFTANNPDIKGCVAFYAPADLHFAYQHSKEDDILQSPKLMREYLGGTPTQVPSNYDSSSAIRHVIASSPATLLFHGTKDPMVWVLQSRRFDAELAKAGTKHLFVELPWATHAFDCNLSGPGGQISTYCVDWFLANLFNSPAEIEK